MQRLLMAMGPRQDQTVPLLNTPDPIRGRPDLIQGRPDLIRSRTLNLTTQAYAVVHLHWRNWGQKTKAAKAKFRRVGHRVAALSPKRLVFQHLRQDRIAQQADCPHHRHRHHLRHQWMALHLAKQRPQWPQLHL
jgi:hypothetical protein